MARALTPASNPAGIAGATLLLWLAACAGPRPDVAAGPEAVPVEHGFHGINFGTALSVVKHDMRLLVRKGKWHFYSRRRENLTQGQAELTAVHYGFYRGKLLSITVYAKGEENAAKLLGWLEQNYGAARPGEAGRMFWDHEHIRAIYEFNSANQAVLLSVSSRKLLQVKELGGDSE